MQQGTVKWFNKVKGFGFITSNGTDVFVHYRHIVGTGLKNLEEGQTVQFVTEKGDKGLSARGVEIISDGNSF